MSQVDRVPSKKELIELLERLWRALIPLSGTEFEPLLLELDKALSSVMWVCLDCGQRTRKGREICKACEARWKHKARVRARMKVVQGGKP